MKWELEQDGQVVASGDGGEGWHYAMVYNQDGPVRLYEVKRGKRELVCAATKGALLGGWAKALSAATAKEETP